jgi:glycosyltransferase involved in cell wall biosynthesis
LKIVHVAIRFPPATGGGEQVVYNLAKYQVKNKNQVHVITTNLLKELPRQVDKNLPRKEIMDGINVIRMKTRRTFLPIWGYGSIFSGLGEVIREIQPDIIHTHSYGYYHSDKLARLRKKSSWKLVMTSHGFTPGRGVFRGVKKMYTKLIGKKTVKRIDYATALSESDKRIFEELGSRNTQVIHNGLDFGRFKDLPNGESFRKKYNITGKMILSVGRLIKGHEFLIKSFAEVLKSQPDVSLVIVGEDWGEKARLKELVRTLKLEGKVIFTGFLSLAQMPNAYVGADIFVNPSEHESFGIVILEAMACKKPCIATKVGAASEIIGEGNTGLLVDYGNSKQMVSAILNLLNNDDLRRTMGDKGRQRVIANFTWEKIGEDYSRVYESVLNE